MGKRFVSADPTANAAIGLASNFHDPEHQRRLARAREARDQRRNAAIAARKAAAEGVRPTDPAA